MLPEDKPETLAAGGFPDGVPVGMGMVDLVVLFLGVGETGAWPLVLETGPALTAPAKARKGRTAERTCMVAERKLSYGLEPWRLACLRPFPCCFVCGSVT